MLQDWVWSLPAESAIGIAHVRPASMTKDEAIRPMVRLSTRQSSLFSMIATTPSRHDLPYTPRCGADLHACGKRVEATAKCRASAYCVPSLGCSQVLGTIQIFWQLARHQTFGLLIPSGQKSHPSIWGTNKGPRGTTPTAVRTSHLI